MTERNGKEALIAVWLEKSDDSLQSAKIELKEGHTVFALNRIYYACFYAATALLLKGGKQYSKHSAAAADLNRLFIKPGIIDKKWNKFYQRLFDDKQYGDYHPTLSFDADDIASRIEGAREFIHVIRDLISTP